MYIHTNIYVHILYDISYPIQILIIFKIALFVMSTQHLLSLFAPTYVYLCRPIADITEKSAGCSLRLPFAYQHS